MSTVPAPFTDELGFIPHLPGQPEAINADSFDEDVLESSVPVLVEFWASRCGPCRRIAPELAFVASHFEGQVRVFTLNVDEELEAAQRFGVWSIPAVLGFASGKEVTRLVGESQLLRASLVDLVNTLKGDANAKNHVG